SVPAPVFTTLKAPENFPVWINPAPRFDAVAFATLYVWFAVIAVAPVISRLYPLLFKTVSGSPLVVQGIWIVLFAAVGKLGANDVPFRVTPIVTPVPVMIWTRLYTIVSGCPVPFPSNARFNPPVLSVMLLAVA